MVATSVIYTVIGLLPGQHDFLREVFAADLDVAKWARDDVDVAVDDENVADHRRPGFAEVLAVDDVVPKAPVAIASERVPVLRESIDHFGAPGVDRINARHVGKNADPGDVFVSVHPQGLKDLFGDRIHIVVDVDHVNIRGKTNFASGRMIDGALHV